MKFSLYAVLTLLLINCSMKKNTSDNADLNRLLEYQWTLKSLSGNDYILGTTNKTPMLEFDFKEGKIIGTDGCNRFFGSIDTLDANQMKFGMLASTKMMCPNHQYSTKFLELLQAVETYEVLKSELKLKSNQNIVLMTFKKQQ